MNDFTMHYRKGDTLGQLRAENDSAAQWLKEHASSEPWQWMGNWLCIEHRYISDILVGIEEAGYGIDILPF